MFTNAYTLWIMSGGLSKLLERVFGSAWDSGNSWIFGLDAVAAGLVLILTGVLIVIEEEVKT